MGGRVIGRFGQHARQISRTGPARKRSGPGEPTRSAGTFWFLVGSCCVRGISGFPTRKVACGSGLVRLSSLALVVGTTISHMSYLSFIVGFSFILAVVIPCFHCPWTRAIRHTAG